MEPETQQQSAVGGVLVGIYSLVLTVVWFWMLLVLISGVVEVVRGKGFSFTRRLLNAPKWVLSKTESVASRQKNHVQEEEAPVLNLVPSPESKE